MKPTPTKVALLVSTAGLGLSWSGISLAAPDSRGLPTTALTFGAAPIRENACHLRSLDGTASCLPADGDLLQTIVANAATLPLPLVSGSTFASNETVAPVRVSLGPPVDPGQSAILPVEDGESTPDRQVAIRDTSALARTSDEVNQDGEFSALALVLLDDPKDIAKLAASESGSRAASRAKAPPTARSTQRAAVSAIASKATVMAVAPSNALPEASRFALRSGTAEAPEKPAASAAERKDWASPQSEDVDRIFASLAEVLGSDDEEALAGVEKQATQAARSTTGVAERPSVGAADSAQAVRALRADEPSKEGTAFQRSSEANDIVVVPSHSDKVLMTLAAVRSGVEAEIVSPGVPGKKTVVVEEADKVLETLALFRSKSPKSAEFACTDDPEGLTDAFVGAYSSLGIPASEPEPVLPLSSIGQELDIDLDALLPVAKVGNDLDPHAKATPSASGNRLGNGRDDRTAFGGELVALSQEKLDEVRGGFVTDGGLKISFGIERAVYLNGDLVTTTSLNIADLSKISGGQAQVTGDRAAVLALVQSGSRNVFMPGNVSASSAGMVIQNTLDNQKINTITRIDAVVNSSSILRSINLQSSMRSALIDSLRR